MNRRTVLIRATFAGILATVLVVAGLAAVLFFVGHSLGALPAAWTAWIDPEAWLPAGRVDWLREPLHVELVAAVLGVLAMLRADRMLRRRRALLAYERQRTEDRLRRVRQYREPPRTEPYIGPGIAAVSEPERVNSR